MSARRCPKKRCGCILEEIVLRGGRTEEHCAWCARRNAGVCRDCPLPVDGVIGRAIRCKTHKLEAKRAAYRRYMSDPETRRRKNAQTRKRQRRADVRARRREQRRAWRQNNAEREKYHRRRYLLKQTPGYRALQAKHNADPVRQQKKREHALRRYYELNPVRPATPICAACGEPITYWKPGRGRPPKYHAEHSPWRHQLKGARGAEAA